MDKLLRLQYLFSRPLLLFAGGCGFSDPVNASGNLPGIGNRVNILVRRRKVGMTERIPNNRFEDEYVCQPPITRLFGLPAVIFVDIITIKLIIISKVLF